MSLGVLFKQSSENGIKIKNKKKVAKRFIVSLEQLKRSTGQEVESFETLTFIFALQKLLKALKSRPVRITSSVHNYALLWFILSHKMSIKYIDV